jgi:hypothetical protein
MEGHWILLAFTKWNGISWGVQVESPKQMNMFFEFDKTGDRHFNHFTGFKYNKLEEYNVDLLGEKQNDRTLFGFLYQVLCNSEEIVYEWLLDWLAFTLQKPCELIGVAPVFISEEGAGKQPSWDFFGKLVIGSRYFVTKEIDGLLGKFNESIGNKFLIVCNEYAIKDSHMESRTFIAFDSVQI